MRHLYFLYLTCLSFAITTQASAEGLSNQDISKLSQSIEFEYQERIKVCDTLNWNASDVCEIQALNKKLIDQAELRASAHPTIKNRQNALKAHIEGKYAVTIAECNNLALEARKPCWEAAEVERALGIKQLISDQ